MHKDVSKNIEQIYSDICLGYSKDIWKDFPIFIKHLSTLDYIEIDYFSEKLLENIKKKGIKSRSEKIEWLIDKKLWNKSREIEINQQKDYVGTLQKTNEKLIFKSQKEQNEKILKEESNKLNVMIGERESLIGTVAEQIVNQKMQFYYIYFSFYKNKNLNNLFFTLEEINNLDDEDSYNLLSLHLDNNDNFDIKNIKKIAISPFFTNNFYICGDNIQSFLGKPVYLLTNYQSILLSYGAYYKNLLASNPELPAEMKNDPDKMEEFINKQKNLKEAMNKIDSKVQSVGIPATKSDFESMGLTRDTSIMDSKGPQTAK